MSVIAPIALLVSLLIGAVGVGGVGLPPALTWFAGFDPHTAAGTGGPVFLIPVLLALRVPAVTAVAAGQVIQLPLVGFATAAYASQGLVVLLQGTLIGVIAAAGVVVGARLALRLRQDQLQRITSAALIILGVVVLAVA
ncbi:TSUP family transporter [Actinoplanes sp. NPDC049596]|uniref:TSUP family transporter n=1 Tax=unclassified Actinoplanes TaxID=2626549 RepID=UPI0034371DF3